MLQFILTIAIFVTLVILLAHLVVLFFETFIPDLYAPKKEESTTQSSNKFELTPEEFEKFESVVTGKSIEELAIENAKNFGPAEKLIFYDPVDFKEFDKSMKKKKKSKKKKSKAKKSKRSKK